jgi:hypothetical protein
MAYHTKILKKKKTDVQQHYAQLSYTTFHPNGTTDIGSTNMDSFTPLK